MTTLLVRDLMHIGVATCPVDTLFLDAVRILLSNDLESLVILDGNGHAAGLFGRREAVAAFGLSTANAWNYATLTAADVMQPDIPEVPPDIPATAAVQIMLDKGIRALYLMHHDGGISWPAAVLGFEDVLQHLTNEGETSLAPMKITP